MIFVLLLSTITTADACPCDCATQRQKETIPTEVADETISTPDYVPGVRNYAMVQYVDGAVDNRAVVIVAGEMTPDYIVERTLRAKLIQSDWLTSFTCQELDRVQTAIFVRNGLDLTGSPDKGSFGQFVGLFYTTTDLTRDGARYFFSSQDLQNWGVVETQRKELACK